jgi:hypothetical protein
MSSLHENKFLDFVSILIHSESNAHKIHIKEHFWHAKSNESVNIQYDSPVVSAHAALLWNADSPVVSAHAALLWNADSPVVSAHAALLWNAGPLTSF